MWTQIINTFLGALQAVAETKKVSIQEQSQTTVNKSMKSSSHAIKAANKALDIAIQYCAIMSKDDRKEFERQKKIFDNNIGSK